MIHMYPFMYAKSHFEMSILIRACILSSSTKIQLLAKSSLFLYSYTLDITLYPHSIRMTRKLFAFISSASGNLVL